MMLSLFSTNFSGLEVLFRYHFIFSLCFTPSVLASIIWPTSCGIFILLWAHCYTFCTRMRGRFSYGRWAVHLACRFVSSYRSRWQPCSYYIALVCAALVRFWSLVPTFTASSSVMVISLGRRERPPLSFFLYQDLQIIQTFYLSSAAACRSISSMKLEIVLHVLAFRLRVGFRFRLQMLDSVLQAQPK